MKSESWREKRREAFLYHGQMCAVCGETSGLHVHHLTYDNFRDELMSDLSVLCEFHQMEAHDIIVPKPKKKRAKEPYNKSKMAKKSASTKKWIADNIDEALIVYSELGRDGILCRFGKTRGKKLLKSKTLKLSLIGKV